MTNQHLLNPVPDPLSSPDVGRELAAARLMIQHLVLAAGAADSPFTLAIVSNAIARQLEAIGSLLLKSHLKQGDPSAITNLLYAILDEMSHETEVKL
jgi:hypothetical protein